MQVKFKIPEPLFEIISELYKDGHRVQCVHITLYPDFPISLTPTHEVIILAGLLTFHVVIQCVKCIIYLAFPMSFVLDLFTSTNSFTQMNFLPAAPQVHGLFPQDIFPNGEPMSQR